MQKLKIKKILNKKNKIPITCLTAYSKTTAQIANKYGDIVLVGDSLGISTKKDFYISQIGKKT